MSDFHTPGSMRTASTIMVVCFALVFLSLAGTILYSAHVNGERRATAVATCERGNVLRAKQNSLILFLNDKLGYTGTTTPLVNCGSIK